MVVHVTRSATLRTRKMLFARGNRIFLRANGFDFFFSCLKVCKLTRATVCIYICNLVFVHFERHRATVFMNVRIAKQIGEEKELFIDVLFRLKINNIPFKSGPVIVIDGQ